MPRKANYGFDYDDDNGGYEEYEDDEYEGGNDTEAKDTANGEGADPRLWRCSVCAYDNDENTTCCDMCGVLRILPPTGGGNINKKAGGSKIDNTADNTAEPRIWCCSVCAYDNDESTTFCDMCGVLRILPSSGGININKKAGGSEIDNTADNTAGFSNMDMKARGSDNDEKAEWSHIVKKEVVGDAFKEYGISKLAKGLFASVPHQTPNMIAASLPQTFFDVIGAGNRGHGSQNDQQDSHVFIRGQSAPRSRRHKTIAPFKFDIPSPDDAIYSRLHPVKKGAPPGFTEKDAATSTQSKLSQVGNSIAFGGQGTSLQEGSANSTLKVLKNLNIVQGPSTSERSDTFPAGKLEFNLDSIGDSYLVGNGENLESVSHGLEKMSLNNKPGSSKSPLVKTFAEYKPEKWMLPEEDSSALSELNLAIVGHVDSGKSSLSGRLLYLQGQISQKQMHKYEKEAKQQGKGSSAFAFAMDESAEERERGITMTVAVAYFDTKRYHVILLDSPGHKDFVPNMISGATQADAAILVIDASAGAYETGMDIIGGQSREHAQLIRSFGVDQIIVAINKMDTVAYSKERFEMIKQQVGSFLRLCGFKESRIFWIPLSAMENQNLVASASEARLNSWYKGPHLLDAIDSLRPPRRDYEKPCLMPICDVVKTPSMAQISACGKLEAGALRSGCKVLVMPSGDTATVRSIAINSEPCSIARAGQNIAVVLQGIDFSHVKAGGVLCHPDFPARVASRLELKILVLEPKIPILRGLQVEFQIHHAKEAARVVEILSLLDPKTGKEIKKAPRHLLSKQSALIEVALQGEVCVEDFSTQKALGRIFLRQCSRTIAVGVVTRVLEDHI